MTRSRQGKKSSPSGTSSNPQGAHGEGLVDHDVDGAPAGLELFDLDDLVVSRLTGDQIEEGVAQVLVQVGGDCQGRKGLRVLGGPLQEIVDVIDINRSAREVDGVLRVEEIAHLEGAGIRP
jgi:hypothetical protein